MKRKRVYIMFGLLMMSYVQATVRAEQGLLSTPQPPVIERDNTDYRPQLFIKGLACYMLEKATHTKLNNIIKEHEKIQDLSTAFIKLNKPARQDKLIFVGTPTNFLGYRYASETNYNTSRKAHTD